LMPLWGFWPYRVRLVTPSA